MRFSHFMASYSVPHSTAPPAPVGVRGTHEFGPPPGFAGARVVALAPAGKAGRLCAVREALINGTASGARPRAINPSAWSMSFSAFVIQTHGPLLPPAR